MTDMTKTERTARDYIEKMILTSDPLSPKWNRENLIFRKQPKWNYMDSCIIRALLMYGGDELLEYAVRFVNSYVDREGNIPTVRFEDYNLDNICGGMNLLRLYGITGDRRYSAAARGLYEGQLKRQPRLSCGSFWHKAIYQHQMWLDGAYMALPFLAAYGKNTGETGAVSDALSQVKNIRNIMRDDKTGLYYHGYCETREMLWSDPDTGLSREFWLRSNGWLCAGLADLYELTEDKACGDMLSDLLYSLAECITPDGMLLQLPARPELGGNYCETSGTLLFAYAAMKSRRMGIAPEKIFNAGRSALEAVTERYIIYDGEMPVLKNICLMGGLGGAGNRDGSAEYYLSERIVENDAKGIAPYLMAACELKRAGGSSL